MKPEPTRELVTLWLFGLSTINVAVGLLNLILIAAILHGLHL